MNKVFLHKSICSKLNEVYALKNEDYGDSFAIVRKEIPNATLVRLSDKYLRLKTLMLNPGKRTKVDESIEDTLLDLANYCIMELIERGIDAGEVFEQLQDNVQQTTPQQSQSITSQIIQPVETANQAFQPVDSQVTEQTTPVVQSTESPVVQPTVTQPTESPVVQPTVTQQAAGEIADTTHGKRTPEEIEASIEARLRQQQQGSQNGINNSNYIVNTNVF